MFQSNHAIFTMASDSGYFSDAGLRVKIDRGFGSADTISKVAAGTYDFGFADLNLLVDFNAKNPANKVVGVFVSFDAKATGEAWNRRQGPERAEIGGQWPVSHGRLVVSILGAVVAVRGPGRDGGLAARLETVPVPRSRVLSLQFNCDR